MKVARCKMKIEQISSEYGAKRLIARPVYDPNPESENGKFFSATPGGTLDLSVVNEASIDNLNVGDEIYVDISKVGE
jgi:hypothetical protein